MSDSCSQGSVGKNCDDPGFGCHWRTRSAHADHRPTDCMNDTPATKHIIRKAANGVTGTQQPLAGPRGNTPRNCLRRRAHGAGRRAFTDQATPSAWPGRPVRQRGVSANPVLDGLYARARHFGQHRRDPESHVPDSTGVPLESHSSRFNVSGGQRRQREPRGFRSISG